MNRVSWFPALLTRLSIGFIFVESGWGKLHNLDKVIGFFTDLGIAQPQLMAPFVATVEFVGGLFLMIGLLSRLTTVPLIGTMVVAIITAKAKSIEGLGDLVGLSEYLMIVGMVWITILGPEKISVDYLLHRRRASKM